MADKPIAYTRHAGDVLRERGLDPDWVEAAVRNPDWVVSDPVTEGATRRFKSIEDFGDRTLRVVCLENASEIRILTAFFDRKARRPR